MNLPGYDSWKLSGPPESREDAAFVCEDRCGWSKHFRYVEDAPEVCPDCGAQLVDDTDGWETDLEAETADRAYDMARERELD